MPKTKTWIKATRLRTLPLSVSGILLGSSVAHYQGNWNVWIFVFALITTILFQIVSNFANDLGDSQKGTDNAHRIGPERTVQSGLISHSEMKKAVIITAVLAFCSSAALIFFSEVWTNTQLLLTYAILAILCVLAAISYTVGKKAYGYHGLGDLMVFIFFGGVSVLGVYSLYTMSFWWPNIHLVIFVGLLSTAVLNLNNMRDYQNDAKSGKRTLVVQMGPNMAKFYHMLLIITALVSLVIFIDSIGNSILFLALLPASFLLLHMYKVMKTTRLQEFDPELKKVALSTFAISLFLCILMMSI